MLPEQEKLNPTFKVTYGDGTSDIIKPASWKKLEDIEILSMEILKNAYERGFSAGSIFRPSNVEFWESAKKLASLLPVVGKEEPGFDPENIDSIEELTRIFISCSKGRQIQTGSVSWNGDNEKILPSEICRIHNLNFINLLLETEQQIQEEKEKKPAQKKKSASST